MKRTSLLIALALSIHCGDDDGAITDASPDTLQSSDAGNDVAADIGMDSGDDLGVSDDTGPGDDTGVSDAAVLGDTWETFAQEFFATYCVECHSGGRRDYRTIEDVRRDMQGVRCGVGPVAQDDCAGAPSPSQFPIGSGPRPSDEDRTRLVEWIEAGLL